MAKWRGGAQRPSAQAAKGFLRYHDPANWPLLREALKEMGRADLIGNGKKQLIPAWQPAGVPGKSCGQPGQDGANAKAAGKPRGEQNRCASPVPGVLLW